MAIKNSLFKFKEKDVSKVDSVDNWRVLIVDDEEEVHNLTKLVLKNFTYDGKGVEFLSAYSAKEAKEILQEETNISLVLLDVVMETDDAGPRVVEYIRTELKNDLIRVVLRTGQPGSTSEDLIVSGLNVNDYKEKQDLSASKLKSLMTTNLRSYSELIKLDQNRSFISEILNTADAYVVVSDKKGIISSANKSFERVCPQVSFCIKTKKFSSLFFNAGDALHIDYLINSSDFQKFPLRYDTKFISFEKELFISWSFTILKDPKGLVEFFVAIGSDITELKNTEITLKNLNTELLDKITSETQKNYKQEKILIQQSRLAAMGEMIGNIAHQWRQPLTVISLMIQDIEDMHEENSVNKDELKEDIVKIKNSIKYMSNTIDDFRNFFKPNRITEEFYLVDSINDSVCLIEATLKIHSIKVLVEIEENLVLNGFPNELSQVILNLISNSKDAIIENGIKNGEIKIRAKKKDEDLILIEVEDNGGGIEQKNINEIFEPYFTTKAEKGTGVGLYMSKMIIEKSLKGEISVISRSPITIFTLVIKTDLS